MEYGNNFYAFNPSVATDRDQYQRSMRLIKAIYDVLNEKNINIKSRGYTFMKDAICIITDLKSMDVCLSKEVYPLIADKYHLTGTYVIEHAIRNAIKSACRASEKGADEGSRGPDVPSTNKPFLLMATQEVSSRLLKDVCD